MEGFQCSRAGFGIWVANRKRTLSGRSGHATGNGHDPCLGKVRAGLEWRGGWWKYVMPHSEEQSISAYQRRWIRNREWNSAETWRTLESMQHRKGFMIWQEMGLRISNYKNKEFSTVFSHFILSLAHSYTVVQFWFTFNVMRSCVLEQLQRLPKHREFLQGQCF